MISRGDSGEAERERHALLDRYAPNALEYGILNDPSRWKPYKLSESTVVYLEPEGVLPEKFDPPAVHPLLDQIGLRFHPEVLPIVVGTTVDFPNSDPVFHNVFSYSKPREFDLGRYPMGDSRSVTFNREGIVRVYCDIHSSMSATILVLSTPYFATPDEDGTYAIQNIPPGRYRLNLWHGRDMVARRWVDIAPGDTATENLIY